MTTKRSAAAATIFSRRWAPPPPLISQPSGVNSSVPSIAMSRRASCRSLRPGCRASAPGPRSRPRSPRSAGRSARGGRGRGGGGRRSSRCRGRPSCRSRPARRRLRRRGASRRRRSGTRSRLATLFGYPGRSRLQPKPTRSQAKNMTVTPTQDYKVADLGLAEFGRKEISLAEHEMPGLMSIREEFGASKPLAGARISGALHMTIQTAVLDRDARRPRRRGALGLLQHLLDPGPRRGGGRRRRTAPSGPRGVPIFAWKGETLRGVLGVHAQTLDLARRGGPNMLLDDGGDATLVVHKGVESSRRPARCPTPDRDDSEEYRILLEIADRVAGEDADPLDHSGRGDQGRLGGDDDRRPPPLPDGTRQASLLFPAINVNDSVTKSKFDNKYGCRHSLIDGINRATDVLIGGKVAVVCGYGDVGKGCARVAPRPGRPGRSSPRSTRSARCRRRWRATRWRRSKTSSRRADIFVTATGSLDVITARPHGEDEARRDRRQHRPLRQRDRHGRARRVLPASSGSTSSRRSTSGSSPTATRSSSSPRAAC